MMGTAEFLKRLFNFLNVNAEYAVLRNFEGLPQENKSRDIDIAIEKKTFLKIRTQLVKLIIDFGWNIVTYLKSDRLITWVCGSVQANGRVELVQLDFFYHTSVFGIILLENRDILSARRFNGEVYHADKAFEFLDKYVYDRAVGADYPEKYRETREAAERDENVLEIIRNLFGKASVSECDMANKKELLKVAIKWNFRKYGIKTLGHYLRFLYYRISNYIWSRTGFSIGFTGPDGSGKTTVIDLMIEQMGEVFRKAHLYCHFRPLLFGNLGDVAQSAGLKKDVDREYDKPHRGGKTNPISSLLRLLYYSADYIIGYFIKIKSTLRITRLVIFDRYYTDIICDSRRSRIYLNYKFLYWFGKIFIPSLNYNILLTASTETILSRKQELDKEGIKDINAKIDYLSNKKGYYRIMNDGTPKDAVAEILNIVFTAQHQKNLQRLGL